METITLEDFLARLEKLRNRYMEGSITDKEYYLCVMMLVANDVSGVE